VKQHAIPLQYQTYKDVFEKNIVDMLLEHWPYNCAIEFEEGTQPPFEPIYNLFQDESIMLWKYMDENFKKGFIWHCNLQLAFWSCLSRVKMIFYKCVLIIVD
jgi:hypothetical protein